MSTRIFERLKSIELKENASSQFSAGKYRYGFDTRDPAYGICFNKTNRLKWYDARA